MREFLEGKTYTQRLSKKMIESGGLMPEAIVISRWTQYLVDYFTGQENIIFDGAPRKITEAVLLDGSLRFYDIKRYKAIYINVSNKWATERLLARKRNDDSAEGIAKRMDWFEKEVMQSVDFFRVNQHCEFIEINGEQTIEEVHKEIMNKVKIA